MTWTVPNLWEGGRCIVIGGGPSLTSQFDIPPEVVAKVRSGEAQIDTYSPYMSLIHDEHVIGVNNAYKLGRWVDICFFCDSGWYDVFRMDLATWPNLKVTCCPKWAEKNGDQQEGVKYLKRHPNKKLGLSPNPSMVCWNFNSGSSAINLAVLLGAKRIILLGFDMCLGPDERSHWHKGHGHVRPPAFKRHSRGFPQMAEDARALGVEILNASPTSTITSFSKVSLREALI